MSEPYKITLTKEGPFDGLTPMTFDRTSMTIEGRQYSKSIEDAAAGLIDATFFGLFAADSIKVVGLAGTTWNPGSVARVLTSGAGEPFRQEVQLTPEMTHVVLFPGDGLGILTVDDSRPEVQLVVNEVSESEDIRSSLMRSVGPHATRFRIIKDDGTGFLPNVGGPDTEPVFTWNPANNVMETRIQTSGRIPSRTFCTYPKHQGCYASVRFSGGNDPGVSKIYLIEAQRSGNRVVQTIKDMKWSKVLYLAHDDMIAFETEAPGSGTEVVIDIELVRVEPGDRLRDRYGNND